MVEDPEAIEALHAQTLEGEQLSKLPIFLHLR